MSAVDGLVSWLGDPVEDGLSDEELARAEAAVDARFPPLWRAVLRRVHPVGAEYPDWRLRDGSAARMAAAPVDGLLFDVEHNDFWWPAWGTRPDGTADRLTIAAGRLASVPRLVPLRGHWYVAEAASSPVFSVVQSDLWSPASSLAALATHDDGDSAPVAFWSELLAWAQAP